MIMGDSLTEIKGWISPWGYNYEGIAEELLIHNSDASLYRLTGAAWSVLRNGP